MAKTREQEKKPWPSYDNDFRSEGDWSREDAQDWDSFERGTFSGEGVEVYGAKDRSKSPRKKGTFWWFKGKQEKTPQERVRGKQEKPQERVSRTKEIPQERRKTMHTERTNSIADDGSDERKSGPCAFLCCFQILMFLLVLGAIFGIGIVVGMSIKRGKPTYSAAGIVSAGDTAVSTKPTNDEDSSPTSKILVGAYYYPWHGSNFHNGGGYVRNQLDPPQEPTLVSLGEYDDSKPETIKQHLAWSRQANIGLWVTSWWGPNRLEDSNTRDVIMEHEDLGDMKIALHYESTGRIRDEDMSKVKSDVEYMCERYFDHPSYYRIGDRPVIVIYVTRKLETMGLLNGAVLMMRTTANKCGHNIYLVGDHVFQKAPEDESQAYMPFLYFDAVTNYDVYGSMGSPTNYAGAEVVDAYYEEQDKWRTQAISNGCHFIPAVSPGFNDRGVRLEVDHPPLARRLTADAEPGSLFAYSIQRAKKLVDPMVDNLLLVNSFNEWHEDSQIEPAVGGSTTSPEDLTGGVEYVGYGELYLNLLRQGTVPGGSQSQSRSNIFATEGDGP